MTSSLPTTKTSIGLGNVDNTSDANKPVSTAQQAALDLKENLANKGASSGYAPLDSSTKVPLTNLPVASSGSSSSLQVVRADDSRLSDARPPDFDTLNWSTNADYTTVATRSVIVRQTGTLTQTRTVNLPLANTLPAGSEVVVAVGSSVSSTINVTIARQGSDTINGSSSSITVAHPYAWRRFITDGSSSWVLDAGVLRSSNNLSDVSSVTTSMTNLSAGSTISGTSISSSNKIADRTMFDWKYHLETSTVLAPLLPPTNTATLTTGAGHRRVYLLKAIPSRDMTLTHMGLSVSTAASANDSCDLGIYDSSGTLLRSTGSATGRLNSVTALSVALSSSLAVTAGSVYYLAFLPEVTATGPVMPTANPGVNTVLTLLDGSQAVATSTFSGTANRLTQYYAHNASTLPSSITFSTCQLTSSVVWVCARTTA